METLNLMFAHVPRVILVLNVEMIPTLLDEPLAKACMVYADTHKALDKIFCVKWMMYLIS